MVSIYRKGIISIRVVPFPLLDLEVHTAFALIQRSDDGVFYNFLPTTTGKMIMRIKIKHLN